MFQNVLYIVSLVSVLGAFSSYMRNENINRALGGWIASGSESIDLCLYIVETLLTTGVLVGVIIPKECKLEEVIYYFIGVFTLCMTIYIINKLILKQIKVHTYKKYERYINEGIIEETIKKKTSTEEGLIERISIRNKIRKEIKSKTSKLHFIQLVLGVLNGIVGAGMYYIVKSIKIAEKQINTNLLISTLVTISILVLLMIVNHMMAVLIISKSQEEIYLNNYQLKIIRMPVLEAKRLFCLKKEKIYLDVEGEYANIVAFILGRKDGFITLLVPRKGLITIRYENIVGIYNYKNDMDIIGFWEKG